MKAFSLRSGRKVKVSSILKKLVPDGRKELVQYMRWMRVVRKLHRLGGISKGNKVIVYRNGLDCFNSMWREISRCKSKVWLEMYMIKEDEIGKRTIDVMAQAKTARPSLDLKVVLDSVGSLTTSNTLLDPIIKSGGDVYNYNPIWPLWRSKRFGFFRNHRKILVCDNVVFLGGRNIAEEYADKSIGGTNYFQDMLVRIEGPAKYHVITLLQKTLRDTADTKMSVSGLWDKVLSHFLHFFQKKPGTSSNSNINSASTPLLKSNHLQTKEMTESEGHTGEDAVVQILESDIRRNRKNIQKAHQLAMKAALKSCYIITPYCIPPRKWLKGLKTASERGVEVKIITTGKDSDVPLIRDAAWHWYDVALKKGIRIYEYMGHPDNSGGPKAIHSKIMVVDKKFSSTGSSNQDPFSYHYNNEVFANFFCQKTASWYYNSFHEDLKVCKEIHLSDIENRSSFEQFKAWLSFQFFSFFHFGRQGELRSE